MVYISGNQSQSHKCWHLKANIFINFGVQISKCNLSIHNEI